MIDQEQRSLRMQIESLRQYAFMTERLDETLDARLAAIDATDPGRATSLRTDVLLPVRVRRRDILTQLAVVSQGYAALGIVKRTNDDLIGAVRGATTTMVAAVRTAALVAQAIANRRAVEEQIDAVTDALGGMGEDGPSRTGLDTLQRVLDERVHGPRPDRRLSPERARVDAGRGRGALGAGDARRAGLRRAARLTLDAVPSGRGWAGAYEGDVGKQSWTGIPKAEITTRLGELLAVEFVEREELGPGGTATRIATLDNDAWVALEIERSHARPVHNVLRYWPWMDRTRRRLVVVHAILPDAPQQDGPRTELTIWTGELMERVLGGRFTYCRVELGSDAEDAQLEAALDAVAVLRRPQAARPLAAVL